MFITIYKFISSSQIRENKSFYKSFTTLATNLNIVYKQWNIDYIYIYIYTRVCVESIYYTILTK